MMNRSHARDIFLGLLLATSTSALGAQSQHWGAAVDGVALSLSAEKLSYRVGEQISVVVTARNVGHSTLLRGGACDELLVNSLVVTAADGSKLTAPRRQFMGCGYSGPTGGDIYHLEPGAQLQLKSDLRESVVSLPTGVFNVQALRIVGYDAAGKPIYSRSNVIQIRVIP